MNARAAVRLEEFGFKDVFRYALGKMDWAASGLPMQGEHAEVPNAGVHARRDVPTCRWDERLSEVRERVQAAGWGVCVVVNSEGIVLGRLRGDLWNAEPELTVEDVMEDGPTTIRPDVELPDITERMQKKKVGSVVVTDSDGRLIGVLYRKDADQALRGYAVRKQTGGRKAA